MTYIPFVLSLSKHEPISIRHPVGEHEKTPFALRQAKGEQSFFMLILCAVESDRFL